jgi:hypothetical protein
MNRKLVALTAVLAVGLLAGSAVAQGPAKVAGKWETTIETPRGTMTQTYTFIQDGEKVTGKLTSPRGEVDFNGTIKGKELTFSITRQTPNGEFTTNYKATVEGDTLKGTISTPQGEREWTAKRVKE